MSARRAAPATTAKAKRKILDAAGLLMAAAGATGPDAVLIQAAEECLSVRATAAAQWHAAQAPRIGKAARADLWTKTRTMSDRCAELERWLVATPARTTEGVCAKLRCAIDATLGGGWISELPRAAMEDALARLR